MQNAYFFPYLRVLLEQDDEKVNDVVDGKKKTKTKPKPKVEEEEDESSEEEEEHPGKVNKL